MEDRGFSLGEASLSPGDCEHGGPGLFSWRGVPLPRRLRAWRTGAFLLERRPSPQETASIEGGGFSLGEASLSPGDCEHRGRGLFSWRGVPLPRRLRASRAGAFLLERRPSPQETASIEGGGFSLGEASLS